MSGVFDVDLADARAGDFDAIQRGGLRLVLGEGDARGGGRNSTYRERERDRVTELRGFAVHSLSLPLRGYPKVSLEAVKEATTKRGGDRILVGF